MTYYITNFKKDTFEIRFIWVVCGRMNLVYVLNVVFLTLR